MFQSIFGETTSFTYTHWYHHHIYPFHQDEFASPIVTPMAATELATAMNFPGGMGENYSEPVHDFGPFLYRLWLNIRTYQILLIYHDVSKNLDLDYAYGHAMLFFFGNTYPIRTLKHRQIV